MNDSFTVKQGHETVKDCCDCMDNVKEVKSRIPKCKYNSQFTSSVPDLVLLNCCVSI